MTEQLYHLPQMTKGEVNLLIDCLDYCVRLEAALNATIPKRDSDKILLIAELQKRILGGTIPSNDRRYRARGTHA